jgi:GT2 family glycosyltransferase
MIQNTEDALTLNEIDLQEVVLHPCVSVVIVHHRGVERLLNCLEALLKTDYDNLQVFLVDNGSEDKSVDFAEKIYGDQLKIIRSETNLGFVGGNNLALKQVWGKFVVLLNDDTEVAPDWLSRLVDVADSDSSIGAVQPKLLSLTAPRYFEYNGCAGGMMDAYGVPLCRGRVFDVIEEDRGQYDSTSEIFWAGGAAILINREILDKTGLLDENFFAHMEEIDLCWRIRLLGYRILSVPSSIVFHLGGGTSVPEKHYLKHRNNLVMMLKNYSNAGLLRFFSLRMALDAMCFLYYVVKRDRSRSFCVPRSYAWLLRNLGNVYRSRKVVQRLRTVSDREIIRRMIKKSVVIQHFLMKRKYFNQIY